MSKKIGEFTCQSGLIYFFVAEGGKFVNLRDRSLFIAWGGVRGFWMCHY